MENQNDHKATQYLGYKQELIRGPDTIFSPFEQERRGKLGLRLIRWTSNNDEIETLAIYRMRYSETNQELIQYVLRYAIWKKRKNHPVENETPTVEVTFCLIDENPDGINKLMLSIYNTLGDQPFADVKTESFTDMQIAPGYQNAAANEWFEENYIEPAELAAEEMYDDLAMAYRQPNCSIYVRKDEQSSEFLFCDLPDNPVTRIFNEAFEMLKIRLAQASPQKWCEQYGVSPYHEHVERQRS